MRIDWKNDYGHIGFVAVAPALRSQGIGKAMVEAMLKAGFEEHGFHSVDLFVLEDNTRAIRFYENDIGFRVEGLMRDIMKRDGRYTSWIVLSMLKDDWLRREAERQYGEGVPDKSRGRFDASPLNSGD